MSQSRDISAADAHVLKTRQLAQSLASCPGWTDWALPQLRTQIQFLEDQILNSSTLRGAHLDDARAGFQALTKGFLDKLHSSAEESFRAKLPSVINTDVETHLPDTEVKKQTLEALKWKGTTTSVLAPAPQPPVLETPIFNPFSGLPQ